MWPQLAVLFMLFSCALGDSEGSGSGGVNAAVACIIAREMLEGIMFISSHAGAVYKSDLDSSRKSGYYRWIFYGVAVGLLCGLAISLGVGFGLASISDEGLDKAEVGMEAGEGVSKLIGFFFVTKMMLKLPQWFGISNFNGAGKSILAVDSTQASDEFVNERDFSFNLFWNIMRESAEAGCFVAIEVFISQDARKTLNASVVTGVFSAVGFALVWAFGNSFMPVKPFAVVSAIIIQMLAVGLFTGACHAFEEVHEMEYESETPKVWESKNANTKNTIDVFSFFGLNGNFTALQLVAWVVSLLALTAMQLYHNYYGYALPSFRNMVCGNKETKATDDAASKSTEMVGSTNSQQV